MRALLDTHTFLWWITDDTRLSTRARKLIGDGHNKLYFSAASGWEIAIKAHLGRISFPKEPGAFIPRQLARNGIEVLPVTLSHALYVYGLPSHHRDPFDRLLVAQSQLEDMPLLTADPLLAEYAVETVW
jgi:PIN domain nuclease of toxin-antitoxin system